MSKVSIIMPVYNSEKYIDDTIKYVLSQTYEDFEFIIVNDGSMDSTQKICEEYAKKDSRIRLFNNENGGVSRARNFAISKATGEYIRFIDADDKMEKDSLEILVDAIEKNDEIDIVIGKYFSNDQEIYTGELEGIYSVKDSMPNFLKYMRTFFYGVTWNKLYKRSVIEDNKLSFDINVSWSEDLFFNLDYLKKVRKIYYVNKSVYYYIRRENGLASSITKYNVDESISIEIRRFREIYDFIEAIDHSKENIDFVYNFLFVKVNEKLNEIMEYKEKSTKEKKEYFLSVVSRDDLIQYFRDYPYRNDFMLNRIICRCIKERKTSRLFRIYRIKYVLKSRKRIKKYFMKKKIQTRFPL